MLEEVKKLQEVEVVPGGDQFGIGTNQNKVLFVFSKRKYLKSDNLQPSALEGVDQTVVIRNLFVFNVCRLLQ